MLTFTKDIHRMRDEDRQLVSILIRNTKLFSSSLRCRVRICRVVAISLLIRDAVRCNAEDFICAKIDHALKVLELAGIVENIDRTNGVVHDELHWMRDRTINVRRRGKMKNDVHITTQISCDVLNLCFQIMPNDLDTLASLGRITRDNIVKTIEIT